MKTRDLILSLSKDEAKISCFFSILLGIDMNCRWKGLRERRLMKRSLLRLLGRIACNPPPCQRRPNDEAGRMQIDQRLWPDEIGGQTHATGGSQS